MLVSAFAFSCMNSAVKYLVDMSAFEIVFFRSVGTLVLTSGYLYGKKIPALGNNKKSLTLRSFVGVISMILFFMSTKYIPIGTAVSLRYLAIFSIFLLKETIKHWQWLFFFIAFLGVLVLKGLDAQIDNYGLLLAVASAVFSGLVFITISKIGKSEHPVVIVHYFMFISAIVGGVLSINNWTTPEGWWDWFLVCSLGFFGYFGQVFLTKAFQVASTNLVSPLNYLEVIFTVFAGMLLFDEIYSLWSIVGILLIILGLVLNFWYKANIQD